MTDALLLPTLWLAVKPFMQALQKMLKPIAQAVQERLSATVPASKMRKEKLVELRSALGGALYPVEGSGELLSNLLGPELLESDARFDW